MPRGWGLNMPHLMAFIAGAGGPRVEAIGYAQGDTPPQYDALFSAHTNTRPARAHHRCPTCGASITTEVCVGCEVTAGRDPTAGHYR